MQSTWFKTFISIRGWFMVGGVLRVETKYVGYKFCVHRLVPLLVVEFGMERLVAQTQEV